MTLFDSYLSNRKQQIKIGHIHVVSSWGDISKGVPQGSILGPILFNVFINDIFLFIKHGQLYNYADDNTLSMSCPDFNVLIESLVDDSKSLIQWFDFKCMQANPEKFQALAVGKKTHEKQPVFKIGDIDIKCDESVKLLGLDIDVRLRFDEYIANLCREKKEKKICVERLLNRWILWKA